MAEKSWVRGLVIGVPTLVVLGAVSLSMLGYGAASAIESGLGVPTELTYDTPLDLLHLSSHAISGWIEIVDKIHTTEDFKWLAITATGVGLAITLIFIGSHTPKVRKPVIKAGSNIALMLSKISGWRLVQRGCTWLLKEKISFIPFAAFAIAPWLVIFVIKTVLILFAILPYFGYLGAMKHIQTWIVSAEHCAPIGGRNERIILSNLPKASTDRENKIKVTPCLALWKNGSIVAEGRHIASTERTIILFNPVSGNVVIEPTEGSSLRLSGLSAMTLKELIETPNTDN
ncbi:hypothetical protein [Achromobacter marplatensis]|jgi:hypothetical protein|uniref:Uncharacterized protein n=1 Tax=Achromobacter marplatensis TaxID=470868 RepID=A0AA42W6Q5_9BURK|nr:hypothetical protein [Achromobacter marplatensis]MDH2049635.1 hypothetical protein [Achromobacter marplatensis]